MPNNLLHPRSVVTSACTSYPELTRNAFSFTPASYMKLLVSLLLALLAVAAGHTTSVCSSATPDEPGKLRFWLGTYHYFWQRAAGYLRVRPPGGSVLSFPFLNSCGNSRASRPHGPCTATALKTTPNCGVPANAIVTCYEIDPAGQHTATRMRARATTGGGCPELHQ